MGRFSGSTAVVTGASRGIGAALAERLAAEGASVALVARTVDRHDHLAGSLNETLERCRRHGAEAVAIAADLADSESRASIVPRALELLGDRIDILVNNAAAAMYAPSTTFPLKRRRITFEVNVQAPIDLMQMVVPPMVERGEGWIVNVTSAASRAAAGPPFDLTSVGQTIGVYGASKAALNRVTNAFAAQLYGSGVRVNAIEPRAAVMSEGAAALVGDSVTSEQVEPVEGMVEAITYLCRCDASRTGGTEVSLDLIDELGLRVHELDGVTDYYRPT